MSSPPRPPGPPPGPAPGPPPPGGGGGSAISLRQLLAIGVAGAVVVGIVLGVLLVGGSEAKGETVQLEPTGVTGSNPFMPPLSPGGTTTPSTLTRATSGEEAFGGTGDDTLCDRDRLVAFLTDPAHGAQAREWARVLGTTVAGIPGYVADLVPTVLASDTAVTNYSFVGGRAVAYQAVLQAGTAALADTRGALVARCRSGNPLRVPERVTNPVYTGPRWPRFDPTVIVIVLPSNTPVFPPGGDDDPDDVDIAVTARSANIDSTDSVITVTWTGTFQVSDDDAITGRGRGTLTFSGNCFRFENQISDLQFDATFDVAIAGNAVGRRPNPTYALTFAPAAPAIGAINGANLSAECRAVVPVFAASLITQALGPLTVPAARGTTQATSGPYNLVVTLS